MLKKFLQYLENPLYPLLGPTLRGLQAWGMWQPNKGLSRVLYNLMHISAILFVLSQYVELWIIRSQLELAMRNLSVTMLSTVCVVKAGTFVIWQKYWRSVIQFVSTLEQQQLSKKDATTEKVLKEYTKYSRSVTYFYWSLVMATFFTVILAPLTSFLSSAENMALIRNGTKPYPEIMSSWLPFDKTRGSGYCTLVVIQSFICVYGGGIVAHYDSNAVVLMSFFTGQLRLLKTNCARLFGDGGDIIDYREAMYRIRECHLHHLHLVKNAKVLNSLLSPVMFLYIIICSLMICASAVQLTTKWLMKFVPRFYFYPTAEALRVQVIVHHAGQVREGTTGVQQIWIAEYLIALIAQLFLYCWHSNDVLYMSLEVDDGVYESAWWSQDVRVRRSAALLLGQLRRTKTIVFTAGPFTNLTVSTFVAILKGSYSYYTLLSKRED